jgi:hypothetical protein
MKSKVTNTAKKITRAIPGMKEKMTITDKKRPCNDIGYDCCEIQ